MEALVSGFADRSIKKHYSTALNKIKAVLRHSQKEKVDYLHENIRLQVPERFVNNLNIFLYCRKLSLQSRSLRSIIRIIGGRSQLPAVGAYRAYLLRI